MIEVYSDNLNTVIDDNVREPFSYSGLATFYNGLVAYIVDESGIKSLGGENFYSLSPNQHLAEYHL